MQESIHPPLLKSGEIIQRPYYDFMQNAIMILQANNHYVLQLEPEFHDSFACSSCGLCCQRPWWISITREYYEKWNLEFDSHASGLYRQPFLLRADPSEGNYADIRRKPGTSECIFLMDDRRCFVHANYGESALNWVCQSFPRYEGWFGSFMGKFMLTSCPEVETLAQHFPGIRYQIGTLRQDTVVAKNMVIHPLGLYSGYLWLGLQLDLLHDSRLTPVETLRCLSACMREKLEPMTLPPPESVLESMHLLLHEQTVEEPEIPPPDADLGQAYDCLEWLLTPYQAVREFVIEVKSGWREMPRLSETERALLNSFLRNYLAYRLLTMNYYAEQRRLFFYPAYFILAANVALLQWLVIYYCKREGTELNQEQLLRAATVVGYRFEHASELVENAGRLTPAACLAGMYNLLSFDFGKPA